MRIAMRPALTLCLALLALPALPVAAEEIGCTTTEWKLIGANHRVCVYAYDDPKIPGVTCHVSQARTGGIKGSLGLAEDPSQFSIACRQTGPIVLPEKLPAREVVFSEDTSLLFKETQIHRLYDTKRKVLVYLGISRKIISGAPGNAISSVPVQPWPGAR
ncbi:CreA family protein [Azovibrio sp.]|uniref:CreA family protein n=2 Tax=Azovibrio sp. TaxID=1872673 RepID=UPI003C71F157